MDSILEDIRKLEIENQKNIQDARQDSKLAIEIAKDKASALLQEARDTLEARRKAAIDSANMELEKKMSSIHNDSIVKSKELEKKAQNNKKETINLVIQFFEEEISKK